MIAYSLSVILGVHFTIGSINVSFLHEKVFHTRRKKSSVNSERE